MTRKKKERSKRQGGDAAAAARGSGSGRDAADPGRFSILVVFDDDDATGFVYSHRRPGFHRPEFLARNVPREKVTAVSGTMNFLADRTIHHCDNVSCNGLALVLRLTEGDAKKELLHTHCTAVVNREAPLFELLPHFPWQQGDDSWGSRPPAPRGKEDMVNDIVDVWKRRGGVFILYIDGNPGNCALRNIKRVDLAVALKKGEKWKVDWDMHLTSEQIDYVRQNSNYFRSLARVLMRGNKICENCGFLPDDNASKSCSLMQCSRCKCVWYCNRTCQTTDWPDYKKNCRIYRSERNNIPTEPTTIKKGG